MSFKIARKYLLVATNVIIVHQHASSSLKAMNYRQGCVSIYSPQSVCARTPAGFQNLIFLRLLSPLGYWAEVQSV